MIASMYRRRMKAAFVIAAVIIIIGIIVFFIDQPDSSDDWMNLSSIGVVGLFTIFIAISSRGKYQRVKDIPIPESKKSVLELDHLVFEKRLGIFPAITAV